ncbi:DUF3106 domain-containing protein [Ideonella dechloratans]|uniref:DUF3106 domain-containing protein n=1 Tax=Ideonella dechloratans TaxID=36863 RepID=UPI0035B17185
MTPALFSRRLQRQALGVALCLLASACVWAQPASAAAGVRWQELPPAQQRALAPLAHDWDQLPEERQRKWQDVARRFDHMTPAQRQRVQQRMTEWARMSPQERDRARLNYQKAQELSASERQSRWEAYQALSPEQRKALAAKAKPASATGDANALRKLRRAPVDAQAPKSNIVSPTKGPGTAPRSVSPVMVQGRPGASTSLVNERMKPPAHQPAGQPKITASPSQVDRHTLLPRQPQPPAAVKPGQAPTGPGAKP